MEKEQWNIQMLNTTTKYTSLLRTKAKLESIFDNLVNVGFVDFDRLDSNKVPETDSSGVFQGGPQAEPAP
jgi:hypothetical protein